MPDEVRIKLNKEQTLKFYSFLVDDAIRIANERKRQKLSQGGESNHSNYSGSICEGQLLELNDSLVFE